jgi:hypothetical protein
MAESETVIMESESGSFLSKPCIVCSGAADYLREYYRIYAETQVLFSGMTSE